MNAKPKPCKGTSAVSVKGCGKSTLFRKYGLCQSCLRDWYLNTEDGQEKLNKATLKATQERRELEQVERREKEFRSKEWKQEKKRIKKELETKSDLEKKLQKEINSIVRKIDKGNNCISSKRPLGDRYDAGHYFPTNSNPTIRFNLLNIWSQSVHDNRDKHGNQHNYYFNLGEMYGESFLDELRLLRQIPPLHLSKDDLREATKKARSILRSLEDKTYTEKERLQLRRDINTKIGLYSEKKFKEKIAQLKNK